MNKLEKTLNELLAKFTHGKMSAYEFAQSCAQAGRTAERELIVAEEVVDWAMNADRKIGDQ